MQIDLILEHAFQGNIDFAVLCIQGANFSSSEKLWGKKMEKLVCLL